MSFFVKTTDIDRLATSGEFQEAGELLQLDHPSRIFLDLKQEEIRSFRRENADLIIESADGSQLRVANFYSEGGDSQLYLKGDDGELMLAVLSPVDESGSLFSQYVALTEASPFQSLEGASTGIFSDDGASGSSWLSKNWGLVALGLLGIGGAAAAVGGLGDGGGNSTTTSTATPPDAPATPIIAGNVGDALPMKAVTVIDDTSPVFSGEGATAGNTITLYEGTAAVATAVVATGGTWSLTPTLSAGTHSFTLTEKTPSGLESAHTSTYSLTVKSGTLDGGSGDDLLIGGSGDNVLNGNAGDDTLVDGIGNDIFDGGDGNDEIIINGTGFTSIDGGLGVDTLTLDNGISLDMTSVSDTSIHNIERIDLGSDPGANTLTLTATAVENMTDANNQLYIIGDGSDSVNAIGATFQAQETVDGITYNRYGFDSTPLVEVLLIEEGVTVVT